MFLQDGGAMKFCFNLKGDAGDKFCSLCCNCRAYNFEGMEEDMLGSDVCSLKELQLATDAEVLQAFQTCKEKKRTLSKSDFALWETATGITYNDYALFLNEELLALDLLQPVSQYCHDWMHALCSQGVMQVAIFRLLDTLSAWSRMESYFKLWQLPAAMKKAGNLHSLFTVKRVASHREAQKFKCTASECLGVCPILFYMVSTSTWRNDPIWRAYFCKMVGSTSKLPPSRWGFKCQLANQDWKVTWLVKNSAFGNISGTANHSRVCHCLQWHCITYFLYNIPCEFTRYYIIPRHPVIPSHEVFDAFPT